MGLLKMVKATALSLIIPSISFAGGCVADVDQSVTLKLNGHSYQAARIVDYIAVIGPNDLFSSKGVRLPSYAAVMQQDRANMHKFHLADADDGYDNYFTSYKRRVQLTKARYYTGCYMSSAQSDRLKSDIENGRVQGRIWTVVFDHPNGGIGVYLSPLD